VREVGWAEPHLTPGPSPNGEGLLIPERNACLKTRHGGYTSGGAGWQGKA